MRKKHGKVSKDAPEDFPPLLEVPRAQWGAAPPVATTTLAHPIRTIIFTHTKTGQCKTAEECTKIVQELQKMHMTDLGMPDIQFNWLVGGGGSVFEGRGWYTEPSLIDEIHLPYAGKSILLAYIGTYTDKFPSDELFNTSGLILQKAFEQEMFDPEVALMTLKINKQKQINQPKSKKQIENSPNSTEYSPNDAVNESFMNEIDSVSNESKDN